MTFFSTVRDALPLDILARRLLASVAVALLVFALITLFSIRYLNSPIDPLHSVTRFEVSPGSSFSRVSDELTDMDILQYPLLFKILARLKGQASAIQTGEYELEPGTTPSQLLEKMVAGDTVQYRVTLVEGWSFKQALEALWASENVSQTLTSNTTSEIATLMGLENSNPEGLLFPDTYFYTKDTSDLEILQRAHNRLLEILDEQWQSRLGALPYESPYEALILASIIEKESSVNSERGDIAGVFIRRLEQGMRLQSDPTVIYGMGENYDGDIRRADLVQETPYNTYRINGLPPTPIALSGLDSIIASLNPLPSDYLYFVAKGDGEHYFSSSLEEHNEAVNRYQRQGETTAINSDSQQ